MQGRSHFRILGIPVRIEPFFLIVAALFGFRAFQDEVWRLFAWIGIVFFSVLIHELGHAFMFRVAGQSSAIVLHGFGGFTVPTGGGRRVMSKPMSIAVSMAGSVAQIVLVGIPAYLAWRNHCGCSGLTELQAFEWAHGWGAGKWDFNVWILLYDLGFISIAWGVLNLMPVRPLDGGHVAEELLGFEKACKLSIGVAAVLALYMLATWGLFGAIFFGLFAFMNYRDLQAGRNENFDVDAPEDTPTGGRGHPATKRSKRRKSHLQPVPSSRDLAAELAGPRDAAEVESAVWNALRSGDKDRAAMLLKQAGSSGPGGFVLASVALAQGHDGLADDLFETAYLAEPGGPPNLVPATLLADHGRAVPLSHALVNAGVKGIEAAGSLQTHLHYAERYQAAAEVGEQVFAAGPSSPAQTAFEVACSWSRAGRPDEALRWVEAAVDAGFKAPALLDSEPDLEAVRILPGWASVRARLSG